MNETHSPAGVAPAAQADQILETIHSLSAPVTVPALEKKLAGTARMPRPELERLLDEQVSSGRLYRFAPYGSKSPRYWDRDSEEYTRQLIQQRLTEQAAKGERQSQWAMTKNALYTAISKRAGGIDKETCYRLLGELVSEGRVYELPKLPGSSTVRCSTEPPRPDEYLKGAVEKIRKVASQLAGADVPESVTKEAAIRLLADAFGDDRQEEAATILLERLQMIEPPGGAGVRLRDLRASIDFRWPEDADLQQTVRTLESRGNLHLRGDDELTDESRVSTRPFEPGSSPAPAPGPTPGPAPADFDLCVMEGLRELTREHHQRTRRVPIHELRQWVRKQAGDEAASHRVFDDRLKRLRAEGRVRLLAISDTSGVTENQLAAAVPGVHETLFYVEEVA
ncbi:MAG: hypothetical protein ACF8TS_03760 [Maioricimonas sp. JB049]